ncbi:MAG TPA: hypothetical protein VNN22_22370 [Verrucomicrobiae bacterium]|nr:hypothetical protein [Verrucomicrobiae bacterium]
MKFSHPGLVLFTVMAVTIAAAAAMPEVKDLPVRPDLPDVVTMTNVQGSGLETPK